MVGAMTYKPTPIKTEGGRNMAIVSDDDGRDLLNRILVELQKINTQLALINDEEITESEILGD